MSYYEKIQGLTINVPKLLVDFDSKRKKASIPTQATSNFITNKEQGDWAESILLRAVNEVSKNFVAVKYGKSDNLMAGEEGFPELWEEFQTELDTIGKRPDILIFNKADFNEKAGLDISQIPHLEITDYVKKAIAGIEVRSSAYLIDRYEMAMQIRTEKFTQIAIQTKEILLLEFLDVLQHPSRQRYIDILNGITEKTLSVTDFRVPSWRTTDKLKEAKNKFKELKNAIIEIKKRDHLSITVKVEDIKVVYKWIETFNLPHFYFQVFFDKAYGISFVEILEIISGGKHYKVEKNKKNQDKSTIHLNTSLASIIASKIEEPTHFSVKRELNKGRLLFYVTYEGGTAFLDIDNLRNILGIGEAEF